MPYTCFEVQIENNIAHVILNRPEKRNAMNADFWRELPEIITEIDQEVKARVIVLSSKGPHFTAGLDLSSFSSIGDNPQEDPEKKKLQRGAAFYDNVLHIQKAFTCMEEARIPVLCCIQGGAIGGGVDLAMACDIRYATEDAFLIIQETNIGMTADVGTFPRITRLLPEGVVKELAYTGRPMGAKEAKSLGIVNEVFPDQETMLKAVMAIAKEITTKAPLAIYGSKRIINYARDHSTSDTLDYIGVWNASMLQQDEINEAMTAASEKREGEFVDLPATRKKMGSGLTDQ